MIKIVGTDDDYSFVFMMLLFMMYSICTTYLIQSQGKAYKNYFFQNLVFITHAKSIQDETNDNLSMHF